ncbi:MAG: trypsin-like peptidase domain-containing protein [Pedobacter sp.]|nr:trypsin-like peptidase domain-containing protein [Pedobacter sp.]
MKKILGISVLAALIGGASALGGYKLLERSESADTISGKQEVYFANNPLKISSSGATDFTEAAAAVAPGVVHIRTTYAAKKSDNGNSQSDFFNDFFGGGGGGHMKAMPSAASGSGVIISPDGYIMTNNHVVENASKVEVILTDRRKVEAKVIGTDPNTDLALIKVDEKDLPVVKMGNSDNVKVGEWVLAVGYPLDLNTTVTAGIVSAKNRSIGIIGREQQGNQITEEEYQEYLRTGKKPQAAPNTGIEAFIQTDAAINPGNSGGALVNAKGELIGINSAIASQSGYNQGYGFAIPINLARKVVDDFMKYGKVKRGYIGVSFLPLSSDNPDFIKSDEVSGLYVSDVVKGGGAADAGIKAGDIIKDVDGKVIHDSPDLQEKVGRLNPGDKVKLSILRDGKLKDFTVNLKGESSLGMTAKNNTEVKGMAVDKLGAKFAPASKEQKTALGIGNGVVVTEVAHGKVFNNVGITKGLVITKVNGQTVNSAEDVQKALGNTNKNMIAISGITNQGTFNYSFPAQ